MNTMNSVIPLQNVDTTERKKRKRKKKAIRILITTVLIIYTFVTITPFYFLFVRSFVGTKDSTQLHLWIPEAEEFNMNYKYGNMATYYNLDLEAFKVEMGLEGYINPNLTMEKIAEKYDVPEEKIADYLRNFIRFNGFITIWNAGFLRAFFNTMLITIGTLSLGSILTIMTGSVLAKFRKKWHQSIYNLYIFSMIIPGAVILLPQYTIITRYLGLYDNYMSLILLGAQGGAIPIMIFTAAIAAIPNELRESVEIDGGSRFTYLYRIILPNMKTPFASYVAIILPNVWNSVLNGILYLKQDHQPITALISSLNGTYTTNYQAMYSGLLISIVPLLIIYLVFQNLF
ncbi:MAG: carbohydrate ABC transporter permease, partial [Vallitaleaceae bacterium]|nr:carbohydrate ABC transporter permease [Vallitaleaceae bacterium]